MFNIFELLYKIFTGKNVDYPNTTVQDKEPVKTKKIRKPRKKKVEK